jgi:predicted RNA binding protein YcfA (HicA-like mRNA interferase family)
MRQNTHGQITPAALRRSCAAVLRLQQRAHVQQAGVGGALHINLTIGYDGMVTWKEVIRKLKAAGFVEKRTGKGSHRLFVHPESGKEIWVTVHGRDAGRLGNRILRDAGVE